MDALKELETAISNLQLEELPRAVLTEIASDPHGLDPEAAPSVLASLTHRTLADCSHACTDLASSQLVIKVRDGSRERLVANYSKMNIAEELRQALLIRACSFETLGAPHSAKAMATLDALFEEKEPIYIALEITSHRVFRHLKHRANNHRVTIFLMPRKNDLPQERHAHHDEVLREWKEFIRTGDSKLKDFIKVRLTAVPYRHLYTSSISANRVRFDMYAFTAGEHSTRRGDMVQADRNTSLYESVYREYRAAAHYSLPLFQLWPIEFLEYYATKYSPPAIGALLAIGFTWYGGGGIYWALLAAIVAGIAGNSFYDLLRERRWAPPDLYKR
jgi:hypothetical protein